MNLDEADVIFLWFMGIIIGLFLMACTGAVMGFVLGVL